MAVGHFSLGKQGMMYTEACSEHDPSPPHLQQRGKKIQRHLPKVKGLANREQSASSSW